MLLLIFGIVVIIFSIVIIVNPFRSIKFVGILTAVNALLYGINNIISSFKLRKLKV